MVHIQGFELEVPVKVCLDRKGCEARRRAAIAAGTLTPTRAEARRALKAGAGGQKQPAAKPAPRRKKARKVRRRHDPAGTVRRGRGGGEGAAS